MLGCVVDGTGKLHGELVKGAEIVKDAERGNVLSLNGTDAYVKLPDGMMQNLNEITIAIWYNWTDPDEKVWTRLFDFGDDTSNYFMFTPCRDDTYTVFYEIALAGMKDTIEDFDNDAPHNKWTHVAVTVGNGNSSLYINGNLVETIAIDIKPSDLGVTEANHLGKSKHNDPLFMGMIDDLVIYGKTLSADQIKTLMKEDFSTDTAPVVETAPEIATEAAPEIAPQESALENTAESAPKTGDENITVLVGLLVVCVMAALVITKIKKRLLKV